MGPNGIPVLSVEDQFVVNWETGGDAATLGFDIDDFAHPVDGKILKVRYADGFSCIFKGMAEEHNRGADEKKRIRDDDRIIDVSQ